MEKKKRVTYRTFPSRMRLQRMDNLQIMRLKNVYFIPISTPNLKEKSIKHAKELYNLNVNFGNQLMPVKLIFLFNLAVFFYSYLITYDGQLPHRLVGKADLHQMILRKVPFSFGISFEYRYLSAGESDDDSTIYMTRKK